MGGAARSQTLTDSEDDNKQRIVVVVGVVLFPSAQKAVEFYNASSATWSACANHDHSYTDPSDTREPNQTWSVGPVSNDNGILSVFYGPGTSHLSVSRALAVKNNVAIDLQATDFNAITTQNRQPIAMNVSRAIAAKVPNQ
jgi:hypothetical protein